MTDVVTQKTKNAARILVADLKPELIKMKRKAKYRTSAARKFASYLLNKN